MTAAPKLRELEVPAWDAAPEAPRPRRFGVATDVIEEIGVIGFDQSRAALAEPIEEIWKGVFGPRHHVELCGPSYAGKSGLAVGVAVAMANPTGKPIKLLDREVQPMPEGKLALVVNEENAKQSGVATIDRWIELLGLPARATWDRIVLVPRGGIRARALSQEDVRRPPLGDRWANLVHALVQGAFGVAIFDTRARIFSSFGNPNDEDAQAEVSNLLTDLIERARCPVVVVSHTKKGAKGDDIEDVSGSVQRGGGADVVLMVTATRKAGRVLSSKLTFLKVRDGGDDHPDAVRFAISKSEGRWSVSVDGSEEGEDGAPAHERVHALLRDAATEMSANEIRKALGFNHRTVKAAIDHLKREGRAKARPTKRHGVDCWVFKATPTWSELMPGAKPASRRRRGSSVLDILENPNDV